MMGARPLRPPRKYPVRKHAGACCGTGLITLLL